MLTLKQKRPINDYVWDLLTHSLGFILLIYFFKAYQFSKLDWIVLISFVLVWQMISFSRKLYYSITNEFNLIVTNGIKPYFVFLSLLLLCYLFFPSSMLNKNLVTPFAMGFPLLSFALSFLVINMVGWFRKSNGKFRYTLVAGTGNMAKQVEKQLNAKRIAGYRIKGFVNCMHGEACLVKQENVVSNLKDIRQYLKENPVDEIVIALPGKSLKKIKNILDTADYFGIRVKYIPDYHDLFGNNYKVTRFGEIDAIDTRQYPIDGSYHAFIKNAFDKIFSAIILLLLAPLFLILAILIKVESPGPIFYCPIRVGKSGKSFKVYKFRSMKVNDDEGMLSTTKDDPRITKLGKILRKYSLDELPQFINVFAGEMSVVGPRPHRRFLDRQLQECVYRYMIRHYVKPGITGWAQVNGWRGPTDTDEQKRQRTLHDLWYLENWSLWLDVKIIFLTVFSKKAHKIAF